ncbi:TIGR04255 family protein [Rugamonas sp.]|uniref:TIGR04255 family protein n=1 Tax=Rugamonas sp. TaxID=1926287 RepID=UPI0025FD5EC1|nr:TIGR04255 family protein [Rugamonas sp.]
MPNAPVYYALAQCQFNPVALMAKYADDIQDILRRRGYTLFEPLQITQLQFVNAAGQSAARPELAQSTSWLLTRADRSAGFILGTSGLTFHTTHYQTSAEFLPELLQGLRVVHDVVQLEYLSRVGVRYLDAVLPLPQETIEEYLAEGLRGVTLPVQQRYALNETVYDTPGAPPLRSGTLVARVHRMHGLLGYPPDMVPNGLAIKPRFQTGHAVQHAVIDTDHFVEGQIPLDFELIKNQLQSLHDGVRQVFDATTSEHARSMWMRTTVGV